MTGFVSAASLEHGTAQGERTWSRGAVDGGPNPPMPIVDVVQLRLVSTRPTVWEPTTSNQGKITIPHRRDHRSVELSPRA